MLLNLSLNNSQFQESKRDQGPQDEMMDGAMEFRALCSATQVLSLDNDKVSWINLEVYNSRMTMDWRVMKCITHLEVIRLTQHRLYLENPVLAYF